MNESQLISLIQNSIIPDAVKLDTYHQADIYSAQYNLYGELKCLTKHHSNIMLEKSKYDELLPLSKARYIVSTPKGVWSWRVSKLNNLKWQEMYLKNYSTHFHREATDGNKICCFIPISEAKNITELINYPV